MIISQIQKEAKKSPIGYARFELLLNSEGSPYDARFLEVNPGFETYFGKGLEDLRDITKFQLYAEFYAGSEQQWLDAYYRVAYEGDSFVKVVKFGDDDFHFEMHVYSPEKGQFITVFQNASSRQNNDQIYRQVLENMSDAVFITTLSGDFRFICPNAHFIFGHNEAVIADMGNISELIGNGYEAALQKALIDNSENLVKNLEQTVVDKEGKLHHLLIDIKAVDMFQEQLMFVCRDISSRKFYENRFKEIIKQAPYGIALVSEKGTPYMVNPTLCEILGYAESELLQMPFKDFTHPADFEEDMQQYIKLTRQEIDKYTVVKRYITKQGEIVYGNLVVCLIDDPYAAGGKRALAMVENITTQMENKLRYETLINTAGDPIYVLNGEGEIVEVNDAGLKMMGYSRDELIGQFMGLINKNYPSVKAFQQMTSKLMEGESVLQETTHTAKDGQIVPVEMNIRTINFLDKRMYFAIARDLTVRNHQEQRLKEKNELLAESERIANLGSWKLNVPENILEWSDQIYRIFGEVPQAFEGTLEGFYDFVHPDDRQRVKDYFNECVTERKDYHLIHRIVSGDGKVKVVEENAYFSYNENNETLFAHGTVQDVTERIVYQNKLARQVQQLQLVLEEGGLIAFEADLESGAIQLLRDSTEIPHDIFPLEKLENLDTFISAFKAEGVGQYQRKLKKLKQGSINGFNCQMEVNNDEKFFWLEINVARLIAKQSKSNSVFFVIKNVQEEKNKEMIELVGQEKERLRISRDIHDSIGQLLVGTRLMLKTRGENELEQTVDTVEEMLSEMIKESRIIINNFGISLLERESLKDAFIELAEKMKRVYQGQFRLYWTGNEKLADLRSATNIFRIYQEALSNTIKYAEADKIEVHVWNSEGIKLEVKDNGKGFDLAGSSTGFGIQNMQQRAEQLGSELQINSEPGKGTSVLLIPIL